MKTKKILLLVTLLIMLVGVATATEVSDETLSTDTSSVDDIVAQDTTPATAIVQESVTNEVKENNKIVKKEKNMKTASKTYDVSDFKSLHGNLTSNEYSTLTINIKSDITITSETEVNNAIQTLTINGNGKTINGNNIHFLTVKSLNNLNINNIKIENCYAYNGGAIYIYNSNFSITSSVFKNNNVREEGGAIRATNSNANLSNNLFENNHGWGAGAVYIYGTGNNYTLNNNTFRNNSVTGYEWCWGGALATDAHPNITNCNFYNNFASNKGGAIHCLNGLNLTNCNFENNTATDHGGAIDFWTYDKSTIIQNNNFINNTANYGGSIDFIEKAENTIIKNNTFLLNTANAEGGAIYYNKETNNITFTKNTFKDNKATNHGGSIYFIISTTNQTFTENTFINNTATYGASISIECSSNNLNYTKNEFINNTAKSNGGAINHWLTATNQTFTENIFENNTSTEGGVIYYDQSTNNTQFIKNTFKNNKATNYGGIISNKNGNLTIIQSTLNNNTAGRCGGAISTVGNLNISNSILNNNTANDWGGAISTGSGTLTITNSTLNNNTATTHGGAIYCIGNITINKCTLNNNKAQIHGGSISNIGNLNISNSILNNNTANDWGGAISTGSGTLTITNSTLNNNTAGTHGGAIYFPQNNGLIEGNEFKNNKATNMGGAISVIEGIGLIESNYFENNSALNGAAIYNTGSYNISFNTFEKNIATNNLAPVIINQGPNTLIEDNINLDIKPYNNTIYTTGTNVNITNNIFAKTNTNITLKVSNTTPHVGSTITINITLVDENNERLTDKTVILTIDNTNYTLKTNNNGTTSQEYKVTYLGAKNITATYNGDNFYNSSSSILKITPKGKYNTSLTIKLSNIAPIVNNTLTITATLIDQNNQKLANQNITITTDTRNYTLKTNSNGTVTQSHKLTKTGLNTITAIYNGDSTHYNSTTINKITVRSNSTQKINTKLTLKSTNNYPSLTETITFTATLTDVNNNKLPNQNITLTIDNTNYTLKTNDKGQVTKIYQPTKASTQTITAKYNGSNVYYANSTTLKITSGNIYVTSNGTGNGRTNTSPTNITNALAIVNNNEIINFITNTTSDTYNYPIFITEDEVKFSTTQFTLLGQKDKNIIINENYLFATINVTIKNIIFNGNDSGLIGSQFTVQNCTFINNSTIIAGHLTTIKNNIITNNQETRNDTRPFTLNGVINILGDNVTVTNNTFENNSATLGGAIYIEGNNAKINSNTFKNNHAYINGGAIYNSGSYTLINNNKFTNNSAINGGAISLESIIGPEETITVTIPSYTSVNHIVSIFINNGAGYYCPTSTIPESTQEFTGIFTFKSCHNVKITENTFLSNNAKNKGVIYISANNITIKENNFTNNYAEEGSSIYLDNIGANITYITSSQGKGDYITYFYTKYVTNLTLLNEIKDGKYAPAFIYMNKEGGLIATDYVEGRINYEAKNTTLNFGLNNSIEENIFRQNNANVNGQAIINLRDDATIINNINDTTSKYSSTIYNNATNTLITKNIFKDSKIATKLTITLNNTKPLVNDNILLTFTLKDESNTVIPNQKITATINNKNYTLTTNANGITTQTYKPTTNGTQTITAKYDGDMIYTSKTTRINITISKINTKLTLTLSNSTPQVTSTITITATLTDVHNNKLANQNVLFTIDSKNYTLKTNNNGITTQTYKTSNSTPITITAKYNGNNIYNNSSSSIKVTAKKINTKLTLTVSNSTPTLNTNITFTATLTDINGNKLANQSIIFNIDGKNYTVKTNNNGIATQTYKTTKNANLTVTAKSTETTVYNSNSSSVKVNIKGKINTKINLKVSNTTSLVNDTITLTATLTDANNKKLANQSILISIENKNYTVKTNSNGQAIQNHKVTKIGDNTITVKYNGNNIYNTNTTSINITVKNKTTTNKINTKTTTSTVKGIIGEKLTFKATVKDTNNKNVNEGNVIFKLNGITIKDNGKLTGSSNPLKVKVVNGVATATVVPDLDMRNANKLTAKYVGTDNYNASDSSQVKIQVSQRNASIVVSSNVKTIKQGQILTITAKVYDTTNGKRSTNLTKFNEEFVYFKVNGITLKDSKGAMQKVKVVNGTATIKYTIPLGLSGVTDGKTFTVKNHTILAGFYNKNYKENIRNTSTFQVERSNITITISNATVNNKTHKLSLTATIKDYLGNKVVGPNKCIIKVNGVTLKNGTQPIYYFASYGVLNIKDINIPAYNKYTSIEIVTQDRLAYKNQRNTTTTIIVTK